MNITKLKTAISYAANRQFYQKHWSDYVDLTTPEFTVALFEQIPVVRKHHLRDHWEDIMEYGDVTDFVSSSGTTGRPVDIPVHRLQEQIWVNSVGRVLSEMGVQPGDFVIQMLSNNDMYTLGMLVCQAAKQQGVGVFRCSPQRVNRLVDIMKYHRPKFIVGNPLFLLEIAERLGDAFPSKDLLPKVAYLAACASFDANNRLTAAAQKVKEVWGFELMLNEYGCSEIGSIGFECGHHNGFHINDDYLHVELLDPETGKPVKEGEPGEVVVTTLTQPRGFAAVRYATGDIASELSTQRCTCGRYGPRLGAIIGRIDHQLKVKGQNLYPEFVLDIVELQKCTDKAVLVRYRDSLERDVVVVWVELKSDYLGKPVQAEKQLSEALMEHIAVGPEICIVEPGTIARYIADKMSQSNGVKVPRLIDIDSEQLSLKHKLSKQQQC